MANPDPAPMWNDLAQADNYGHVTTTYNSGTKTFSFTLFNDQTLAGQKIGGWAVYPTYVLTGIVPTVEKVPPTGWMTTAWEGPVTGLGPQFGNIRDGFVTTSSIFNVGPGGSLSGFAIQWIGANPPPVDSLKFGVEVVRPSGAFWAQAGPNPCEPVPPPIPDASTLVLAGTGILMGLPSLRCSLKKRTA